MSKKVLVIGGTSGIGEALVHLLSDQGNEVLATGRTLPERGVKGVDYLAYDTSQSNLDLEIESLDGLVYCPGSINLRPFNRLSQEDFLTDFNINFLGAVNCIQTALPKLKRSEGSSIVLFSTVAVAQGMPYHASVAASKGAVEGLTRSLAAELAPKIRVNAIAPSIVNTPLDNRLLSTPDKKEASGLRHPLKRVGEPTDIAEMCAFLLSEKSAWMSGQVLAVDGGMSNIRLL